LLALSAGGDAYGQAAAPAAEKLKLSLGGYMRQDGGYADQDDGTDTGLAATNDRKHFDTKQDSEVYFSGSVKLDNGMTVSVMTQLETQRSTNAGGTGDWIDESFMTIDSAYGQVRIGSADATTSLLGVSAPFVGANPYDGTHAGWIYDPDNPTGAAGITGTITAAGNGATTGIAGGPDDNKVQYITPSIAGFRIGGSYIPSTTALELQPTVSQTDVWDIAAQYSGKFDAVALRGFAGYWRINGASETASSDNWAVGADVTFADFTLGGGYHEREGDGTLAAATQSLDFTSWNIGLKYSAGPWAVGVMYAQSVADDTAADPDEDSHKRYQLGGQYTLGPGVTALGTLLYNTYNDETNAAANENSGWALVGSIQVDF
jgi:predicted porin